MKEFPLYPELSEDGQKEAQSLLDKFTEQCKKSLTNIIDAHIGDFYSNLIPFIESDSWGNFRNAIMDGFKNYDNRLIQNSYNFKEIRQQIYKDYKEQIDKDLDQDNLDKIKELEAEITRLREFIDLLNKRY